MNPGDAVWFRQACRGGYGFQRDVPAVFVAAGPRRVTVRVRLRDGSYKRIVVHPKNVRPREDGSKP